MDTAAAASSERVDFGPKKPVSRATVPTLRSWLVGHARRLVVLGAPPTPPPPAPVAEGPATGAGGGGVARVTRVSLWPTAEEGRPGPDGAALEQHLTCYALACSRALVHAGVAPRLVEVQARPSDAAADDGAAPGAIRLAVRLAAPELDEALLAELPGQAADLARAICPAWRDAAAPVAVQLAVGSEPGERRPSSVARRAAAWAPLLLVVGLGVAVATARTDPSGPGPAPTAPPAPAPATAVEPPLQVVLVRAVLFTPTPTPSPTPTPTPSVADVWQETWRQLQALRATELPRAVSLLEGFVARYPDYAPGRAALYAALLAYGAELAQQQRLEDAAARFTRAQALFPERGEASAALAALTPTPAPTATPTPRVPPAPPAAPARAPGQRPASQPVRPGPTPVPTPTKQAFVPPQQFAPVPPTLSPTSPRP